MAKEYFFSINMLIKDDSNIQKAIDSILSDISFFTENVQLLLVDIIGSELSFSICSKYSRYYPENILYIDAVGKNEAEGYNDSHTLCLGKYIAYINNYGKYSQKLLPSLKAFLQNQKTPAICVKAMISSIGGEIKTFVPDIQAGLVKLNENPDRFIPMLGCYFFRNKLISKVSFDTKIKFHSDIKYIAQALDLTNSYIFADKYSYTTIEYTEHEKVRYEPQYSQWFYTPAIRDFIIPMLKEYPDSIIVQTIMMYLIDVKFALNQDDLYKNVLISGYITEFFNLCAEAMRYIPDVVILNQRLCTISGLEKETPFRFLRLKYENNSLFPSVDAVPPKVSERFSYYAANGKLKAVSLSGEFVAHVNGAAVSRSKTIAAVINSINCDHDGIYIDAMLSNCSCFDEKNFKVFAYINKTYSEVNKSDIYSVTRFFDIPFLKKYSFKFFVPIDRRHHTTTVSLYFRYGKISFRMKLLFNGIYSRISNEMKSSYWHFYDRILQYDSKSKSIVINYTDSGSVSGYERKFEYEMLLQLPISDALYYTHIRKLYRKMLGEKKEKKVIMFCENSGVNFNGNLMFRYFSRFSENENIVPYITVKPESKEHLFLVDSGYENILELGTKKAKAAALSANVIFASESNIYDSLGFDEKDKIYLRDLFGANVISAKNTFTTYDTEQNDNRLVDNTQMIFCSSELEKENLLRDIYGYDQSMIKVTGIPLLDAVKDEREKIILIAPGKRRIFGIYEYSDFYRFSNSAFFRSYNSVFSNPELLQECRKKGWKIAVLMPIEVEKYIRMFYCDDIVNLYAYSEQNESLLLSTASVLVTDYSELQYKFAYLNKKVFYYFPKNLPMKSEKKGENVRQYGFGDVILDTETLIESLISDMADNFRQPEKYEIRRRKFFRYFDNQNCKRVADKIIKAIS